MSQSHLLVAGISTSLFHISTFLENELACNLFPSRKKLYQGLQKKIKILAVREVRPNCTQSFIEKYKGLKKIIKEKIFRHVFSFFSPQNFQSKNESYGLNTEVQVLLQTPRSTKFKYVIFPCHMRHLSFYDILCHMTHMT